MTASNRSITLTSASPNDERFLIELFVAASPLAWMLDQSPHMIALLEAQAKARRAQWHERFGSNGRRIIEVDGTPVGHIWTARLDANELRLVDISLLPHVWGQGIGTHLLTALLAEADAERRTMVLHVGTDNPAQRLYQRLGFSVVGGDAMYLRMERPPALSPPGDTGDSGNVSRR